MELDTTTIITNSISMKRSRQIILYWLQLTDGSYLDQMWSIKLDSMEMLNKLQYKKMEFLNKRVFGWMVRQ
jgi:hypothetical protein